MPAVELSPQERIALLALLVCARPVTNSELRPETGVELSGAPRRRLNELKLVTSEKVGRSFRHELTDDGAFRCEQELSAPRPARSGSYGGILYATFGVLRRHLDRSGQALTEFYSPDTEALIRAAYSRLTPAAGSPVRLSAVRVELDDAVSARAFGEAVERLSLQPGVHVRAAVDQQHLTADDRAAAVRLGGEDRHNLQIED